MPFSSAWAIVCCVSLLIKCLFAGFNQKIDHNTAQKMTVGEVLESAPDKQKWVNAFAGFRAAWNDAWFVFFWVLFLLCMCSFGVVFLFEC